MGKIPSVQNMITAMIVEPQIGQTVNANTNFTVRVQTQGLDAGSFTNPTLTYYSAPQNINGNGDIIGHCHITIQDLGGSLNPQNAPDPTKFSFFKGINDAGNGQGLLEATVDGGLVPGFYRVCTMISASNHQPGKF
jgi:transcription initiation factor TFIID subunit 15